MKEEIYLKFTCVLFNSDMKHVLMTNDVISKDNLYIDGYAIPI